MVYSKLPAQWARLIIDGDNGGGKTTLAKRMAEDLEAVVVSLDDHLLMNGDILTSPWDRVHLSGLRNPPVIVSLSWQRLTDEL